MSQTARGRNVKYQAAGSAFGNSKLEGKHDCIIKLCDLKPLRVHCQVVYNDMQGQPSVLDRSVGPFFQQNITKINNELLGKCGRLSFNHLDKHWAYPAHYWQKAEASRPSFGPVPRRIQKARLAASDATLHLLHQVWARGPVRRAAPARPGRHQQPDGHYVEIRRHRRWVRRPVRDARPRLDSDSGDSEGGIPNLKLYPVLASRVTYIILFKTHSEQNRNNSLDSNKSQHFLNPVGPRVWTPPPSDFSQSFGTPVHTSFPHKL